MRMFILMMVAIAASLCNAQTAGRPASETYVLSKIGLSTQYLATAQAMVSLTSGLAKASESLSTSNWLAGSNALWTASWQYASSTTSGIPAQITAATGALWTASATSLASSTNAYRPRALYSPVTDDVWIDGTGGVWRVDRSWVTNWYAAAYGGYTNMTPNTPLSYPLPDTFTVSFAVGGEPWIIIACITEDPYDHYTQVHDDLGTIGWGTTDPYTGIYSDDGFGRWASLYWRADEGPATTSRVDGVVFDSSLPAYTNGLASDASLNLATQGLASVTLLTSATGGLIPSTTRYFGAFTTNSAGYGALASAAPSPVGGYFSVTTGTVFARFLMPTSTLIAAEGTVTVTNRIITLSGQAGFGWQAQLCSYLSGDRTVLGTSPETLSIVNAGHGQTAVSFQIPRSPLYGRALALEFLASTSPTQTVAGVATGSTGTDIMTVTIPYGIAEAQGVSGASVSNMVPIYVMALTNAMNVTTATVWRIGGSETTNFFSASVVPKTGQTTAYAAGADDGAVQWGKAWPNPRFSIVGTGALTNQVRDNLTGLVWARNFDFITGGTNWIAAFTYVTNVLNVTAYGGATDWRMPNRRELESIQHFQYESPCIPNTTGTGQWTAGTPFHGVQNADYWTSNTRMGATTLSIVISLATSMHSQAAKTSNNRFCAVRGP